MPLSKNKNSVNANQHPDKKNKETFLVLHQHQRPMVYHPQNCNIIIIKEKY